MTTDAELRELFDRKAEEMQISGDMQETLARRIRRRQAFRGLAVVAAAIILGLGIWAVSDGMFSTEALPPAAPGVQEDAPAPAPVTLPQGRESSEVGDYPRLEVGELDPGRYAYVGLSPDVVIRTLPGAFTNFGPRTMHLGLPSGGFLDIRNVTGVLSPDVQYPVPEALPQDILAYLQQHPAAETTEPKPVTIGGHEGFEMDIRATSFPHSCQSAVSGGGTIECLKVLYNQEYPVFVQRGEPTRLAVLEVEGRYVGFTFPAGGAGGREAREMIASIEFLPPDLVD